MPAMEYGAAMADVEVAHLAFDAARIEVSAAADAAAAGDFGQ
jgi:hypothetical protein